MPGPTIQDGFIRGTREKYNHPPRKRIIQDILKDIMNRSGNTLFLRPTILKTPVIHRLRRSLPFPSKNEYFKTEYCNQMRSLPLDKPTRRHPVHMYLL